MHPIITPESRPEAMADVPGICELPLTRAVVQYRDAHELYRRGGRIRDIGLAVVVEGRFASSVRAMDLGSAEVKYLNLSSELVILDWVYDPTLAHMRSLAAARGDGAATARGPVSGELRRYCFDLALRILERRGFSPLTRPTLLRIGFRDICKDLDLHDSTVVRIVTGRGQVTRVHLDYDANALVFRPAGTWPCRTMERAIREIFATSRVRAVSPVDAEGSGMYHVRFGVPVSFGELQSSLGAMRRGLGRLAARFEPERFRSVRNLVSTFGERATLDRIASREGESGGWGSAGGTMPPAGHDASGTGRQEDRAVVH